MKKNLVRILALVLVLILALGIIPLGAFAADAYVPEIYFNQVKPTFSHLPSGDYHFGAEHTYAAGSTIKAGDFTSLVNINGQLYDFKGFSNMYDHNESIMKQVFDYINSNKLDMDDPADEAKAAELYEKLSKSTALTFSKKDVKIDPYPTEPVRGNMTDEEWEKAQKNYEDACFAWNRKFLGAILAGYVPHSHALSRWYSDGTTHWRQCLVCKENFMYQNWCTDGDEDEVCNVCGGHVPYHDITVIESEGGTITVNRDTASHRTKITADVKPAAGYRLEKLHFTKVRPDGSKQEVVRYEKGGQFWTNMPTYPMEVTAEFVKN